MDLNGEAVETYRDPRPEGYTQVRRFEDAEAILSPEVLPNLKLSIAMILGRQ